MSSDAVLKCSNLTKRFGALTALHSVSLELAPYESVTVFGRNGAGKSTLLKIAAALIRTYEGNVEMFGERLRNAGEELRAGMGFVTHESFLYPDLTPTENLVFYGRLYKLERPAERAQEMLEQMDLSARAATSVRQLSRGMKQRVSLARAFLHRPRLLLMDEPFTGLDEAASEVLEQMLTGFVAEGGAVLLTTHDVHRGLKSAGRVLVLDHGSVVYETPTEGLDTETFIRTYREILRGETTPN